MHKGNDRPARAWVELDRKALAHNVQVLTERLPPGGRLMPAVKANAYGHGALLLAGELNRLGVEAFCVATAQEGAELLRYDADRCAALGVELVSRPIVMVQDGYVRHHPGKLAQELILLHAERNVRIAGGRYRKE